jgi:hypothetical protein
VSPAIPHFAAEQVEIADDVGGAHVLGDRLPARQASARERSPVVVERPVLGRLVREDRRREEEREEVVVLAVEAVERIGGANAARVEPDHVEAPLEVRVEELAEAAEDHGHSRSAGAAGVHEDRADAVRGRRRHTRERDLGRGSSGAVVVERHLGRRAVDTGEVSPAGLPVDRSGGGRGGCRGEHGRNRENEARPSERGRDAHHDLLVGASTVHARDRRDKIRADPGSMAAG